MAGPLIIPWKGVSPRIAADAFIAPNAVIIGDVEIGPQASIWFNCVLRGDVNSIRVGARTNIQDGTIVHCEGERPGGHKGYATVIGANVLIGHMVMIHGAVLEDEAFIGMSASVLNGAVVETGGMLGAGALLSSEKRVPRGQLWVGRPARFMRQLDEKDYVSMRGGVELYVNRAQEYRKQLG